MRALPLALSSLFVVVFHLVRGQLGALDAFFLMCGVSLLFMHRPSREFLESFAPALLYLILYDLVAYLPDAVRPAIHVKALYVTERVLLLGSLPHQWLADHATLVQDFLAAVPYQLHFIVPIIFLGALWRRWPDGVLPFAWGFGVMNLAALLTQIFWPTAPPWYFERFAFTPAVYGIPGDPAGLARLDHFFHAPYFANMYAKSSVVFGAFPSMHAAWPILVALLCRHCAPRATAWLWGYVALVWWAAVYLQHHYVVDLLGGALYAMMTYAVLVWKFRLRAP